MSIDYKSFSKDGPAKLPDNINPRWWRMESDAEIAASVGATVHYMVEHQRNRFRQAVISARMYGNLSLSGVTGISRSMSNAGTNSTSKERVTYNLVQSVIDTASAKIAENRPKPYFLTSGGDYKLMRKAKALNQFVEGIFFECKAYELGGEAQRDAEIWGDGFVHVYSDGERVKMERTLPSELFVDEVEGQYGVPRQMHRVKSIDREVLLGCYPKHQKEILAASRTSSDVGAVTDLSDMLTVRESWHLPSGEETCDGLHVITIEGCVLYKEEWKHDFFPFARWRWSPRPFGFWSQGLAEQLQSIQIEINKLLYLIQRSYHLGASFKVFLANGSKVVKEHLNNDVGCIVSYTGQKPEYVVPPLVPQEIYQHLERLIQRGYDQAGINQFSSSGTKPAGLNSGKALREYKDEAGERAKTVQRLNERGYLDLASIAIATAKNVAKENRGHYPVSAKVGGCLREFDWAQIRLEENDYAMQCFPISSLPSDPAGRLQTVQEYVQAGFLTPRHAKKLLDFPDLEAVEGLSSAAEEVISQALDGICDDGEPSAPEPTDDLKLAKEMALEYIARGRLDRLDEDRMEMLRAYSGQVDMLQQRAAPPMPMPEAGMPQATPAAPAVSDLLPNAPGAPALQ